MYRKIRRNEKQITVKECHEILMKAEYGTLATMGADGFPYAVPVNYVFHNGSIYFHCAIVGHKLDNIDHCSNVSFNVVADVRVIPLIPDEKSNESGKKFNGFDTNFNSVIVFGKAAEVFGEEKINGLRIFLKRFLAGDEYNKYKETGIKYINQSLKKTKLIRIEISHMTGKRGIKRNKLIRGIQ